MTAWGVVDSGVIVARLIPEPLSRHAAALLANWHAAGIQVAAPTLLLYEVVAVARKLAYTGRATVAEAAAIREFILGSQIEYYLSPTLLRRAYDLATQFNQPRAYDAQYLAVAEHLGCELWTADERLYNSVHGSLPWVKWLGQHTP